MKDDTAAAAAGCIGTQQVAPHDDSRLQRRDRVLQQNS